MIESCPTSNCAVANLTEPPIVTFLEDEQLHVAIATDDPAIFGAWPSQELRRGELRSADRERLLQANAAASFVR